MSAARDRLLRFLASKLSPAGSIYVGNGQYEKAEHMITRNEIDRAMSDIEAMIREIVADELTRSSKP